MTHVGEEELVLYYYGEPARGLAVEPHLAACEECRLLYQRLQRVLNSVDALPVPERPAEYEEMVWRQVAPRLSPLPPRVWFPPWRWALAGSLAVLVVAAFLAGRGSREEPSPSGVAQVRERVLMLAVGHHLERSQRMLVELSNAAPRQALDISFEQYTAGDLLSANRLYRQSAASAGDARTTEILEDLERVLIEIAHSPPRPSAGQLEELRHEIEDREIVSKVKGFELRIREEDRL